MLLNHNRDTEDDRVSSKASNPSYGETLGNSAASNSPPDAGGRSLLVAGFGGLLLLMLVVGGYALEMFERVRASDAQERDVYLRRTRALESVRTGIYQSAIVMRDYLLAPDPAAAGKDFDEWTAIRRVTDRALADCASALDPAETTPFRNLQAEVHVYWKLLDFITELPPENKHIHGAEFLSKEVVRHRTGVVFFPSLPGDCLRNRRLVVTAS